MKEGNRQLIKQYLAQNGSSCIKLVIVGNKVEKVGDGYHSSISKFQLDFSKFSKNGESRKFYILKKLSWKLVLNLWIFEFRDKISFSCHYHCAHRIIAKYYKDNFSDSQLFTLGYDKQSKYLCFKGLIIFHLNSLKIRMIKT